MKSRLALIAILLASLPILFTHQASTQGKRGLLPTDLATIKEVSDAQISPDGSRVVYVVSEVVPDRSRTISRLWVVPASGGEPKRLTKDDANESTPRWSPDGKWVAFYSNRDKKDGLWTVSADGGEPRLATYVVRTNFFLTKAGESFTWSPDSKQIAFLSSPEVLSQPAPGEGATALQQAGIPPQVLRPLSREEIEKLPPEVREMIFRAQGQAMGALSKSPASPVESALSALPDDPRVITRLQYKSRTAFSDNLQSHIFTVDLATRRLRQITTGLYSDQLLFNVALSGFDSRRIRRPFWQYAVGQLRSAVGAVAAQAHQKRQNAAAVTARRAGQRRAHHAGRRDVHRLADARLGRSVGALPARRPRVPRTAPPRRQPGADHPVV